MKKVLLNLGVVLIFLVGCSSNTYLTGTWKNDEMLGTGKYQTVFIAALTPNNVAKRILENELAFRAEDAGLKAIRSHEVLPETFVRSKPSREAILDKIKETNADAIFTISLVDKASETRYVPGNTGYGYAPMGFGYYDSFYGYYSTMYPTMYDPGYYTTDKVYYLESNLYDAETEELIWSGQSETYNPEDIEAFTDGYSEALFQKLSRDGLIRN